MGQVIIFFKIENILLIMDFRSLPVSPSVVSWLDTLTDAELAGVLTKAYNTSNVVGSAELGQRGEFGFELICRNLPVNYKLVNTTMAGKQGDFIISYTDKKVYTCLVDIKNYKSTVPRNTIDKFMLDLEGGNYDCGLLVSVQSKIVGMSESISIVDKTLLTSTIPVMFVSKVPDNILLMCIELLFKRVCINTSIQIDRSLVHINNALSQSASVRRLLTDLNKSINSQLLDAQNMLMSIEVQTKQLLNDEKKSGNVLLETSFAPAITKYINALANLKWKSITRQTSDIFVLESTKYKFRIKCKKIIIKIYMRETDVVSDPLIDTFLNLCKKTDNSYITNVDDNILRILDNILLYT